MSKIYEYLKDKSISETSKNDLCAIDNIHLPDYTHKYTFIELYDAVNRTIYYLKDNYQFDLYNICYLVIKGEVSDIITFIALLELGIKPILINRSFLYDLTDNKIIPSDHKYYYEIIPSINDDKEISIPNTYTLNDNLIYQKQVVKNITKDQVNYLIKKNINTGDISNDFDFGILTSGTTGKSKVFGIKEHDLINTIQKKYDLNSEETFATPLPISAISGVLFALYIPIIGNNKKICMEKYALFLDLCNLKHLNVILPANYMKISNIIYERNLFRLLDGNISDDTLDQVTLLGDKIELGVVKELYRSVPNSRGKVVGYYGRTENLGLISKIKVEDMEPVYLYYEEIYPNKIIFTYDKTNIYEVTYNDGNYKIIKSNIKYNDDHFCEVMPVAKCNRPNENIKINAPIFGKIIADDKETDDFGFYLGNKVYYLARKDEIITLDNNQYYYVSALEDYLYNVIIENNYYLGPNVYCIKNENNHINLYIPCNFERFAPNNFRIYQKVLGNFIDRITPFKVQIDKANLIDGHITPIGCEVGKLKRKMLSEFEPKAVLENIKNDIPFENMVKSMVESIISRKVDNLETYGNYFIFPKNDFSIKEIVQVLKNTVVLDFRENKEDYYLVISDEFLFANSSLRNKDYKDISDEEYIDLINNHQIRDYLIKKHNIQSMVTLKAFVSYKNGTIIGTCKAVLEGTPFNSTMFRDGIKEANYEDAYTYEFTTSLYDIHFNSKANKNYYNSVFTINENDEFYCDEIYIDFDYDCFVNDLSKFMYQFLIERKKEIEEKNKIKRLNNNLE